MSAVALAPEASRRRVLLVLTEVMSHGGIQRFNRTLLTALDELGASVVALSLNDTDGVVTDSPFSERVTVLGFGRSKVRFAAGVARQLAAERFDVLFIGHIHFATLMAAAHCLPRAKRAPRVMLIAHGQEVWESIRGGTRRALGDVTDVVSVSAFTQERILAQAPELGARRLHVFPNALAASWIQWADQGSALQDPSEIYGRYFLSVTRISVSERTKGLVAALEAFATLTDRSVHYVVAGSGDDVTFLRWVTQQLGVEERVHFRGSVSDLELVSLYRKSAGFVLPSGQEGFGIVFLEAMYFGIPVLAAAEKGANDVVSDGVTGLTVPFGDVIGLARSMTRFLEDETLCQRLVANGRALVTGDGPFTFAAFRQRTAALIDVPDPVRASP